MNEEHGSPTEVAPAQTFSLAPLPRRLALVWGGSFLLTGCGASLTLPKRPQEMTLVNLQPADVMPKLDGAELSRRTRVVVMPSAESSTARGAGLPNVAASALETLLGAGGVEVIDRNKGNALQDEIKLADTLSDGSAPAYNGPEVADYAISVVMGTASWNTEFVPAFSYKDKEGKAITIPASHTHSGRSGMSIRVYQLPSLRLVTSVPAQGQVKATLQDRPASQSKGVQLMQSATEDGVLRARGAVLNEFSPKGYVTERRVHEKVSYFRILLGRQTGAKSGQVVRVYTIERSTDPLTKRVTTAEAKIATGRISELVSDEYSYVVVDDEKEAARVRLGDIVRVEHDPKIWEAIKFPKLF